MALMVLIKELAPEPILVVQPLLNGFSRSQQIGFLQKKLVFLDLSDTTEAAEYIAKEFPGDSTGSGQYCFESINYSDIIDKTARFGNNILITGSRRIPTVTG